MKKYFYGRREEEEWSKLCKETVNVDNIKKYRHLYIDNESLRDGAHECINPSPYCKIR